MTLTLVSSVIRDLSLVHRISTAFRKSRVLEIRPKDLVDKCNVASNLHAVVGREVSNQGRIR